VAIWVSECGTRILHVARVRVPINAPAKATLRRIRLALHEEHHGRLIDEGLQACVEPGCVAGAAAAQPEMGSRMSHARRGDQCRSREAAGNASADGISAAVVRLRRTAQGRTQEELQRPCLASHHIGAKKKKVTVTVMSTSRFR